ncbi:retrovirus-related pol polyprotein from transposon TNT 1-94 [Tanacetum coccineum]|uniref:Retrovirus-related pol polyprotein from transposon TNT 1-94 n=1 Tax=Tanacetum coccineum TaxID=301880 RepID=A0ABQ4Z8L9_9ASTR
MPQMFHLFLLLSMISCPDCSLIWKRPDCKDYGVCDYQVGNVTISRVYYVEGLGHNLFFVEQFCYANLEVAFQKNTCFIWNSEGIDLLSGSRNTNLYTISPDDMLKTSLICLLSKALRTKSWLWHRQLSDLNFGTLNKLAKDGLTRGISKLKFKKDHLCSACALGPKLQSMTLATSSLGLVPNPVPRQPFNPPTRNDWDRLCQPMFDEYFKHPLSVVSTVPVVVAPRDVEIDAPSSSTSSTNQQKQSSIISQGVEEPIPNALFDDPCHEPLHDVSTSQESSSNVQSSHSPLELIGKWNKDNPLANVIEPKNFKEVKTDEFGKVLKNKAILVAQGFRQEEGIDFEESFATDNPSHVYKLKKALYGLKQAPRASYDMLSSFLISQHFSKGAVDPTLFTRKARNDLLLYQVVKPKEKTSNAVKTDSSIPKGNRDTGLWYSKDTGMSLTAYSDADYAGCQDTRRSTSRSDQFLGDKLVSLSWKKQKSTAISSTEAEYISLSGCCAQILWMRSQLTDYGFKFNKIHLYSDNKSAIVYGLQPMFKSLKPRTLMYAYHFIKEQSGDWIMEHILYRTEYNGRHLHQTFDTEKIQLLITKAYELEGMSSKTLNRLAECNTPKNWTAVE